MPAINYEKLLNHINRLFKRGIGIGGERGGEVGEKENYEGGKKESISC